ncbi:MAG: TIR domain-containing protein, partial [Candidatus Sumerlaeota bacterium]|nr:TIR domain-containing protein [Candidatus Sumerlaeota bacterium]
MSDACLKRRGKENTMGESKKRIFISYGHDEHAALAARLKDDFKARGHEVWFDAERLHPGGDWERYIEEGLEWTAAAGADGCVVLIMTPHSLRRPDGYCLNELARALDRRLGVAPVMAVWVELPLSICRIQWLDMRDAVPVHERPERYETAFARLVEALEHGRLDFEGAQSRLLAVLDPLPFEADIAHHMARFTGRGWVFNRIDDWLADPGASPVFWITGKPGVGKTAIACRLAATRREVAAFHLCRHFDSIKTDPRRAVLSIAYQLSTQLPDYQDRLAALDLQKIKSDAGNAQTLFDALVLQPLAGGFPVPDRTLLVVVDGLDEASSGGRNELASFIGSEWRKAPPWLRIVVTGRPDPEVKGPLQGLSPFVLDTSSPENEADLREFLARELAPYAPLHRVPDDAIAKIIERSEGVFLYAECVREELAEGRLSLDHVDDFPQGLGGVYARFFARQFPDAERYCREVAPALDLVLAAREPLPFDTLAAAMGWTARDLNRFRASLGSLFDTTGDRIRPFHKSLSDWLTNPDPGVSGNYFVDVEEGRKGLAAHGLGQFDHGPETMDNYSLEWLPSHLRETGDEKNLARLLKDFRYLMEKARRGMLERLLQDFRELPPRLTGSGGALEFEAAFFRERAHILRRGNDEWPAHKILLQLTVEHADDNPLTQGAEKWLEEGRCDWVWLRRNRRLAHAQKSACLAVLEGHTERIISALELADRRLLSWSWDHTLRLWDSQSGTCLATLEGHTDSVKGALALADDRLLSWSRDHTLRLWDGRSGACLATLEGHTDLVWGALELSDGRLLSWSYDNTLRLWDGRTDACLATLKGHTAPVTGALALADGRLLSWSEDSTLRLWDGRSGACLATLEGHTKSVRGALALADGRLLPWSDDSTLGLWDSESGACLATLKGHVLWVLGALELADGRLLSWSHDGTLRFWDDRSGACLTSLEGHTFGVEGALALADGRLLSWSGDHTLRLWDGESGACLAALEGH